MIEHVATVSEASARFASFSAMRVAHTTLLRHYRDKGTSPDLLAEADLFLTQGSATGALIDDDDDRMAAQSLLDYWAAVLCRADRPPVKAVLDDFDPKLSPSLADAVCPYVGLEAFNETTQELYFGRRRVTEELLKFVQGRRLIGVIGPSGSGKSSLVLGGMIPALKVGGVPGSERWRYYPAIVPGANPIANLIAAVQSQAPAGTDPLTDPAKIVATVDDSGDTAGVFVVDQFEELFTLCETDEKREEFVNALLGLTKSQVQPHLVIVTIRSDFETQLPTVTGLQEAFENATYRVPPFTAADLREAIERPADLVGLKFESGLVDRLVKEILGEPAGLPLLQFTLRKLWEGREGNRITLDAYRKLGGGRQALARVADEFYDSLIPEDQITLKRILLRMVRPGAGLEVTSNRIPRNSLYGDEPRDRVDRVLNRVIASRLIRVTPGKTPEDEQIEIAHEALVRNWPRLVEWLEEDRVTLRRRLRLTSAAEQWRAHGKDPGGLLGGSLLTEALGYDDLNALETEFIAASQSAVEESARREEDVRRRELEQTRALAEEQQRRADIEAKAAAALRKTNVRLRRLAILAFALLVLAIGGWAIADQSRRELLRKEQTVRALKTGNGVVVESESVHPVSSTSAPDAATKTPPPASGGDAAPTRPAESAPASNAAAAAPTAGAAAPDYPPPPPPTPLAGGARATMGDAVDSFDSLRIRASSTATGRSIPGTELPAYNFRVWVDGPPEMLARIQSVQYEFNHPTFRQKLMTGRDRASGFSVGYSGWGCLSSVAVSVTLRDRNAPPPPHRDFDMCAAIDASTAKK